MKKTASSTWRASAAAKPVKIARNFPQTYSEGFSGVERSRSLIFASSSLMIAIPAAIEPKKP